MQLVEQHIINDERFKALCLKAKNLYNQSLYYWRQSMFGNIQYFSEYELTGLFAEFKQDDYLKLPAQTAQQIIKILFKNAKSWQKARKEYTKNPSKFLGKPKLPKYKKELSICFFTSQQLKLKNGYIHFPKMTNIEPIKTNIPNIKQCRIVPKNDHFVIEFIYEVQENMLKGIDDNMFGIDLGLNNLATLVSTNGNAEIINGRPLKSINQFYNKRKSKLQSKLKPNIYCSKRITRITNKRNQKVKNYIHHASRHIITKAVKENISLIVIGNNKGWKNNIEIGKKNNQNFVSLPHNQLIEQLQYKAKLEGINVVITEESYTSKCSALDLEPIKKHETYLGKRIKRGLFRTSKGKKINADGNGAINILRKVVGNELKNFDSISSCVLQPLKVNIFNIKCKQK